MTSHAMQAVATKPIDIFLVDDHRTILWGLERLIESATPCMAVVGKATSCAELFARDLARPRLEWGEQPGLPA